MDEKKKPGLAFRIVVPVGVLLAMLALAELFLEIAMPIGVSDRLYWLQDGHVKARLLPGQSIVNARGNPVRINALGFRGEDWSWTPKPGTLRLLALGGSSTFCFQVSDDAHTWPAVLERLLAERLRMPVEVANLGLPGYDTSNSKINYLFTGRALHPHGVLVYHTWNDMKFLRPIDESDGMPREALSGREGTGRNPSAVGRLVMRLELAKRIARTRSLIEDEDRENRYTSIEKTGGKADAPVGDRAWRWFEQNFADIARFARSDGVLPVLISQASLVHPDSLKKREVRLAITNDYVGMTLPRLAESWNRANRIIADVAAREGALFVDGYGAVPHDLTHFQDHVHLLDPGARRLAEAIADRLLSDPRFTALAEQVKRGSDR